jgi:uncharacterized membrane protein YdjX (TVP38/TMEM64 family)
MPLALVNLTRTRKDPNMSSTAKKIVRFLPLALIILAIIAFFYFGFYHYFNFATIDKYQQHLISWTANHYFIVVLAYMLLYIAIVAISVPGAALLTVVGGFLFGVLAGVIYVVVSATIGACLLFLAVRTALGQYLAHKAQGWLRRLQEGFQQNAWNYLLFLRLVPLFPFWVVNIVPALLSVPLRVFASATFLGIIPGSLVFVWLGRDLGALLAAGKAPNFSVIFQPMYLIPIVALAVLSLVPVLYQKFKK